MKDTIAMLDVDAKSKYNQLKKELYNKQVLDFQLRVQNYQEIRLWGKEVMEQE